MYNLLFVNILNHGFKATILQSPECKQISHEIIGKREGVCTEYHVGAIVKDRVIIVIGIQHRRDNQTHASYYHFHHQNQHLERWNWNYSKPPVNSRMMIYG